MTEDLQTEPLRRWNHLARENAENAIVSSMFAASDLAREPIESFSTWLLVGAAAIASFLLGNADKLVPIISQAGFLTCGMLLSLSCLFGLLAKIFSVRHKIASATGNAVLETFKQEFAKYQAEESRIQSSAAFWGITLESGIRFERIIQEFLAPMPWWVRWSAKRFLKKHGNSVQAAYIPRIRNFHSLGICAFIQALLFLGFLGAGFIFAAAI